MTDPAALEAFYHELCAYTLSLGDSTFIHQHVVDAHAAQSARATDKPIRVAFALFGLCLYLEHGYTGRQVQRAHMQLAARRRKWPVFSQPASRTSVSAREVLAAAEGSERERAIHDWARAVWADWSPEHVRVREYLKTALGI